MSTAATERVDLGPLDDFADEEGTLVEVAGRRISLIRLGDDVYAIGDTCSHGAVSLSGGIVDADACTIECPKHGSEFDLRTGEALTLPAIRPIPTYAARVLDGRVLIDVGAENDHASAPEVSP